MELRKFCATSMQEAMAMVRAECGDDAVVLDTRTLREPSEDGVPGAEHVEVLVQYHAVPASAVAPPPPPPADDLAIQVRDLREQLLSVHTQLDRMADEMSWISAGSLESCGELAQCLAESLAGKMPYSGGIHLREGQQHLVALVGPTGVGKTTMLAKLAWQLAVREGHSVGLISTDTLRPGAIEQVTRFSRYLHAPLEVVYQPDQMSAALARLNDCALVLLDTPGSSQRNAGYLREVHELLAAADPMEVHLVLNPATSLPVIQEIIRRYAELQPDQVMLTKLDEAPLSMELLPLLYRSGLALSYLSTGPEINRQLDIASTDNICHFLLNS